MSAQTPVRVYTEQVAESEEHIRLDRFLAMRLEQEGLSRSRIKQWIQSGEVRINGRVCTKPGTQLSAGDICSLEASLENGAVTPEKGRLDIVYSDEDLLVVNKPAGLSVHPAPSCPEGTLVHRLVHHFPDLGRLEGERPGIVHRLDKDTTGLMVVALNEIARAQLSADFADRTVDKTYLALVHGVPEKETGRIDMPIGRHPRHKTRMAVLHKGGREARSDYSTVWSDPAGNSSLLKVAIKTGRTHQIRVHLAELGHPIVGDTVYGARHHAQVVRALPLAGKLAVRQMLHAWRLRFTHPASGKRLRFIQPPPHDFWRLILYLGRHVQRIGVTGLPGCGKSELLHRLGRLGVPTFRADVQVADLYREGEDGWTLLKQQYAERFLSPGEGVAKEKLLAALLESDNLRREVESLIHPLVRYRLERFWATHDRRRMAAAEIPLLLESGWGRDDLFDAVVGVHAPREKRHNWLAHKRGWSHELIIRMESWQWSERDKLKGCDLVLDNSGTIKELDRAARGLYHVLSSMRRKAVHRLLDRLTAFWADKTGSQ